MVVSIAKVNGTGSVLYSHVCENGAKKKGKKVIIVILILTRCVFGCLRSVMADTSSTNDHHHISAFHDS